MNDVFPHLIRHIKAAKKDSLEQVAREIEEYKRGELSGRETARSESISGSGTDTRQGLDHPAASRPESFFACTAESIDEFWGEGPTVGEELVCICRDPYAKPWASCPVHGNVIDQMLGPFFKRELRKAYLHGVFDAVESIRNTGQYGEPGANSRKCQMLDRARDRGCRDAKAGRVDRFGYDTTEYGRSE